MTAHKIGELSLGLPALEASHGVSRSHHPFHYLGSESNGCPTSPFSALLSNTLPTHTPPALVFCAATAATAVFEAGSPLWTASRVSYWRNWKCFVIAFSQILMDVKLNEVWVLAVAPGRREIYHQRLKRLPGTIKAPTPSTSQQSVHYYSLKRKAFNMSTFPCETEKRNKQINK